MEKDQSTKKRIGDILLDLGYLSQDQLEKALQESKRTGVMLGEVLTRLGWITEEQLNTALGIQSGAQLLDTDRVTVDTSILNLVPQEIAREYELIPFGLHGNALQVALSNPFDVVARDKLKAITGKKIIPYIAPRDWIIGSIEYYYKTAARIDEEIEEIIRKDIKGDANVADEGNITRLVDLIIAKGLSLGASDIHIDPDEKLVRIYFRLDGVLHQKYLLPKRFHSGLVTRIKVMGDIPLGDAHVPHDGRMQYDAKIRKIDIRISTYPSHLGESVVMRLLIKAEAVGDLERLGMADRDIELFGSAIHRPHGLILITGPTGSGKTTTCYTALLKINKTEINIMTIEDPIEYVIPTVRQSAVNPKAGFTFASALRAALRQDPDVIMVGEIRDKETAELALRASITGHLVISTLHANEAAGAIPRLLDMGVLPTVLASSLVMVIAQRLARRLCPDCLEEYEPTDEEKETFLANGLPVPEKLARATGCKLCHNTGYKGRVGIFEIMTITKEIEELIIQNAPRSKLEEVAISQGMHKMFVDGLEKVAKRLTSLSEIRRIAV